MIAINTTLAILAGGEGSRMGMAKANLTIDSRPILDYLLDEIAWPGPTMLVTAPGREHPPAWRRFGSEVSDPIAGGGPLRGVLTALEHLTKPLLLVLTVDMPAIRRPHCEILLERVRDEPSLIGVMMRRAAGDLPNQFQIEPFPCAMRAEARAVVERRLLENRRSIHGLLDEPGFVAIDAPETWGERVWLNLNVPGDLES